MSDGMSDYVWEEYDKQRMDKKQKVIIKYNPIEVYEAAKYLAEHEDHVQDTYNKIKENMIKYHNTECYSGIGGFYILYDCIIDADDMLEINAEVVVNLAMGSYITEEIQV